MQFFRKLNNYCLFILVFSVTYENWDPFKLVGVVSVTYMASALYVLSWVPLFKSNLDFGPFKNYIIPLLLYTIVCIFSTALNSGYAESIFETYSGRVVLLILLMLLVANHLHSNTNLATTVLDIYVASVVLMYFLILSGTGTEFKNGRVLLFGENPNTIGVKAAIGFSIVLARLLSSKISFKTLFFGAVTIFSFLNLVILSGSRGALISIFLVVLASIFYTKISLWKKVLFAISGAAFSIYFLIFILSSNAEFGSRILRTVETGDTGRSELWRAGVKIIEDNLLFGVGIPGAYPEMFKHTGRATDVHNIFLYVLMTTGVVGFFFFFQFIFRMGKNLYASFRQNGNVVFLLIFILLLFNMAKTGGSISKILNWFFFAVLIGSTFVPKKAEAPQT